MGLLSGMVREAELDWASGLPLLKEAKLGQARFPGSDANVGAPVAPSTGVLGSSSGQ